MTKSGSYNTALGGAASIKNNADQKKNSVGGYALRRNENRSKNVAVGFEAGSHDNLTSPTPGTYDADGSVFIGHKAGYNYPKGKENRLYIGNDFISVSQGSPSTLIYGKFDNALVEIDSYLKLKPILTEDASKCNSANDGMMYYNSTLKKVRLCTGATWGDL